MFIKRLITHGMIFLGILTAFVLYLLIENILACFLGGILSFLGIAWGWVTLRCPFCRRHLPIKGFMIEHCPHCGEKLQDCLLYHLPKTIKNTVSEAVWFRRLCRVRPFLLLAEGQAVGALVHGGVALMGADAHLLQGAVVLSAAVMGAVLDGAGNAFVGVHIVCSSFLLGTDVV